MSGEDPRIMKNIRLQHRSPYHPVPSCLHSSHPSFAPDMIGTATSGWHCCHPSPDPGYIPSTAMNHTDTTIGNNCMEVGMDTCDFQEGVAYGGYHRQVDARLLGYQLSRKPCANSQTCHQLTGFVHKRNERERERVRCVNEGYARLREHLPIKSKSDKRVSKVETLRFAIKYIKQMQDILERSADQGKLNAVETTAK